MPSLHLIPLNDERIHDAATTCWCNPAVRYADDDGKPYLHGALVSHNAADCREVVEAAMTIIGEPGSSEPEKQWALIRIYAVDEDGNEIESEDEDYDDGENQEPDWNDL